MLWPAGAGRDCMAPQQRGDGFEGLALVPPGRLQDEGARGPGWTRAVRRRDAAPRLNEWFIHLVNLGNARRPVKRGVVTV